MEVFLAIKDAVPSSEFFNVGESQSRRWVYTERAESDGLLKVVSKGLPVLQKNLCYFMYPIKNSLWPFHIEQLKRYMHVFNGKKIITVAVDKGSVPLEEVQAALPRRDIIWRTVPNDPKLWETAAFPGMLELVENQNQNEFTFYAHAKGVRRPDWAVENAKLWSGTMYFFNLASERLTNRILSMHDAMGCYRHQDWNHGGSDWHYSGTYFWFRHSAVFSKNWKTIHPHLYGVEGWIGKHVEFNRSYCLIPPNVTQKWGTAIREYCIGIMKRHLSSWMIGEPAREDLLLV